jgi:hypothetical protein
MFTAKQYRAKAAEYTELLKAASLPAETREFRRLEQSYLTLAENEEWMADNREKIHSPGADNNWYGDAILAQQGKHTLGWHRADVATQSTAMPAKIQQLFDDAGLGGLLQTATLRRQIARFLHKHKVDDFPESLAALPPPRHRGLSSCQKGASEPNNQAPARLARNGFRRPDGRIDRLLID